ncbi:MAG TPA: translocation/assembly module TamB domain-containing protein [Gemmatimonadales bacterium]
MSRRRAVVLASAFVVLTVGLVATLLVVGLTQTSYGRRLVRDLVVDQLAPRVRGSVYVGEISGGLFTGVTVDSLEIRGADDSLFVASGPVTLVYDPRDLIDRRLLLSHVRAERPFVHLRRYEDGSWNFRRIFPSGPPRVQKPASRGFADFIVIDSATVTGGTFLLTMPWHPNDTLGGAKRDSAVRVNLARADAEIRRAGDDLAPGPAPAYRRSWRWSDIGYVSSGIRLAYPDSAGQRFGVARLDVVEHDPPFRFSDVRGDVRLLGDSIWIDVSHFDLPASTGSGEGKIVWGSDLPVRYDIRVKGDSVALADVAWVYETLPTEGGGSMRLHIRNSPDDLHVLDYALSEMDVRTTGSRLRGAMTYGVGGPILVVKDVELRADPVDFDLLRTLAGGPFPYDWQGTLTGTVRGPGGPLDRFRVDSSAVVFRDAHVPGAVTSGSGRGMLDISDPALTRFLGFSVNVARLDLRTPRALNAEFPALGGVVRGRATLDSLWTDVRVRDADVVHQDGDAPPTRLVGHGRITLDDFIRYDLDLQARPLSLTTLALSYPRLPLRGGYTGPLRVRGTLADLEVVGDLTGESGRVAVDGRFDLFGPEYSALGTLTTEGLDLATLVTAEEAPSSDLNLRARYTLIGEDVATLQGSFAAEVSRSTVDGMEIAPSALRARFDSGRALLDSLRLQTPAFTLTARGGLGLVASEPDSVAYLLVVDSLGGLRRFLADGMGVAAEDTLEGTLELRGVLTGSAEGVAVSGELGGEGLRVGELRARWARGRLALADPFGDRRGSVAATLDTVTVAGVRLATVGADVQLLGGGRARAHADVTSTSGPRLLAAVGLERAGDTIRVSPDTVQLVAGDNRWWLERTGLVSLSPGGVTVDTLVLRGMGGGRLLAAGRVPVADSVDLSLLADSVPLRDLGLLAQANTSLDGRLSAALHVTGTRADPAMSFGGGVSGAQIGDVRVASLGLTARYADERLAGRVVLSQEGTALLTADAELPVDLALQPRAQRRLDEALRGTISSGRVDLSVLEGFTTAVRDASGSFTVNVALGGSLDRPLLEGGIAVADGSLSLPNLGIRVRDVQADVEFLGDSVAVRRLQASSADERDSRLSLTGGVGLVEYSNPRFDLTLTARDFRAIAKPRVADLAVSTAPNLRLTGPLSGATLSGGVRVERGSVFLPELSRKRVIDLDDSEFFAVVDTTVFANRTLLPNAPPELVRNLTLRDVGIQMGDDVWLRGPEANIQLGGRVNLTTAQDPRSRGESSAALALDGVLTAVRGTYRLNLGVVQRTFQIERGVLRFYGEPDLNPTLDIVAVHTVRQFDRTTARQDVQVRAEIGGTLVNPQLRLSAGVGGEGGLALSESDAVSYLVTGAPAFAVGTEQSSELTAARVALSSLGSYLGDRAAGGLFDVVQVETAGLDRGQGGGLRSAGQSILAGTRLGLGVQLADRVYVSANAGLCQLGNVVGGAPFNAQDFAESIGVKVDYRLGGGLGLSAGVEPPTQQLFCGREISARGFAPTPRQWTFDLFKTWRF